MYENKVTFEISHSFIAGKIEELENTLATVEFTVRNI